MYFVLIGQGEVTNKKKDGTTFTAYLSASILRDPEGNEIARLRGDADWYSDSARAIISAMISGAES